MSTLTIPKKAIVAISNAALRPGASGFSVVDPEEAKISAFDRSFHFGDSLYEAIRSYNGILFAVDEHFGRLKISAEMAMFDELISREELMAMIHQACRSFFMKFGNQDISIRITVSRGCGDINIDTSYSSSTYTVVFVRDVPLVSKDKYETGITAAIVSRKRNLKDALDPAMKSGNYLNNVLALKEAQNLGAQDAILLNYQGFVTEGTTNNVFAIKNGELWTSPLSIGILAGITRDIMLELARKIGITTQERLFTESELKSADEVFLSSSFKEALPITTLIDASRSRYTVGNGKPGQITQKMHAAFRSYVLEYCQKNKALSLFI